MDYMRRNQRLACFLVILCTFVICGVLFYKYRPNAYEIRMNGQYTFYIKDKGVFEERLKSLQTELGKKFENFKFEDKFTWSKAVIDSRYITSDEDIKNIIISNSKSKFKEVKNEVKTLKPENKVSNKVTAKTESKPTTKTVAKKSTKASATEMKPKSNASSNKHKAVLGNKVKLLRPSEGIISSNFGMRWGKMHKGMDIANDLGAPIYAAMDGIITYSGWMEGYGKVIIIDHGNKIETVYGHCNVLRVEKGEKVSKGQRIGDVGSTGRSTGPHVHFEVKVNGVAEDPSKYI